MWADDAQRQRIFDMIGTHSVTYHRVRNARLEHQRRVTVALLLAAAVLWTIIQAL
jgi:hypothetical protein